MKSSMNKIPPIKLPDQDNTSVQGFEKASDNILHVNSSDCSHCLRPFNQLCRKSNVVNVITAHWKDKCWESCVDKGIEEDDDYDDNLFTD